MASRAGVLAGGAMPANCCSSDTTVSQSSRCRMCAALARISVSSPCEMRSASDCSTGAGSSVICRSASMRSALICCSSGVADAISRRHSRSWFTTVRSTARFGSCTPSSSRRMCACTDGHSTGARAAFATAVLVSNSSASSELSTVRASPKCSPTASAWFSPPPASPPTPRPSLLSSRSFEEATTSARTRCETASLERNLVFPSNSSNRKLPTHVASSSFPGSSRQDAERLPPASCERGACAAPQRYEMERKKEPTPPLLGTVGVRRCKASGSEAECRGRPWRSAKSSPSMSEAGSALRRWSLAT
mmetsp:Transcript_56134/g.131532  ORF Transcript_56134/g.131532 Transcript_56134/m.131532 type:complete len:305 (+) Transcript_56134:382-1296(+)